jgi:hypothetical protein
MNKCINNKKILEINNLTKLIQGEIGNPSRTAANKIFESVIRKSPKND